MEIILPEHMQFSYGHTISNLYDSKGRKLRSSYVTTNQNLYVPIGSTVAVSSEKVLTSTVRDYCGRIIYENNVLSKILTEEGYITLSGSTPIYHYYAQDHLGNNRVVVNQNGTIEQVTHYYAYGLPFSEGYDTSQQPYKYNGKELDRMHGLDWYDYNARFYDPALSVWTTVDPHAENYYSWSPYHYAANNPIIVIDPTGMDWYRSPDGSATMWKEGSDDIDEYVNIGANYTQNIGGGMSVTYTQNEATSMTFTGAEESSYVAQGSGTGCKIASDKMLANEGVNSNGERINVVNSDANGVATTATANATRGINAVDKALENGNPIEVGVDYKPKQINNIKPNGDGMTDHFIVVTSKTETLSNGQVTSKTYNFFDPRKAQYGTSTNNTLQINNNKMTGYYLGGTASSIPYTVTTVRRNR